MEIFEHGDNKFFCSKEQKETLQRLIDINSAGLGKIEHYVSDSNRIKPETSNIEFISNFSVKKMYERKIKALENITFEDIKAHTQNDPKLVELPEDTLREAFELRKEFEMNSLQKSLDGERTDAHREAHDRVYARLAPGIKVHYNTVKGEDGKMTVDTINGIPIAKSILLNILQVNKEVVKEGEYKTVNSGIPVRISNCIKKELNQRSVGIKTLKLAEGKFKSLKVSRRKFLPEQMKNLEELLIT